MDDRGGDPTSRAACDEPLPDDRVSLPRDDAAHNEPVEWWYWTGHLEADDGRWFGFELVFFTGQTGALRGMMVHHALTDIAGGGFEFRTNSGLLGGNLPENGFALALAGQSATGGDGVDVLHGEAHGSVLDLRLEAIKRPVLQHDGGYLAYPWGGYTYYYSRPRMRAEGALDLGGERLSVHGEAWFDHQWGDLRATADAGWDWFALQLDDGREVMVLRVHAGDDTKLLGASVHDAACGVRELAADQLEVSPTAAWQSSSSGCTYPMGWRLTIGDEVFDVTPVQPDQELVTNQPYSYWEGAATVAGAAAGRAYVELVGYCQDEG